MNHSGLAFCSRFSYPPNSLSLCGPGRQKDLKWYANTTKTDKGTEEILTKFSTLYPYLTLIAYENNIRDPFEESVVEAYWLGNNLLQTVPKQKFIKVLEEKIALKKKIKRRHLDLIFQKTVSGGLPHHSYHVLNIYKRTGHMDIKHTVETMDACIINWGEIIKINSGTLIIKTQPLKQTGDKLVFGKPIIRSVIAQGPDDILFKKLKVGDWISYHWGYFCHQLNTVQLRNLIYFTKLSLTFANKKQ